MNLAFKFDEFSTGLYCSRGVLETLPGEKEKKGSLQISRFYFDSFLVERGVYTFLGCDLAHSMTCLEEFSLFTVLPYALRRAYGKTVNLTVEASNDGYTSPLEPVYGLFTPVAYL